ncbi:MAG TPA: acyltransferase [Acidimicrobiales bacterium]|nr:acyltransferase [Acidimicrobiales bacterium]
MTGWSVRGRRLPALDGLRALAVLAVLAYHLDFSWARGGYLGVDLFFVLSGYLITSLLLEEHEDEGTIRLAAFWGRRARRLLPALFAMVTAVMVFVVLEGREGNTGFIAGFDLSQLRSEAFATLLYVANWWQIVEHHSYFAQFSAPSPLQHTWSLAIEEQFYLLWPFVTLGLLAKGLATRRRLGLWVSVGIAAASTVLMGLLFVHGDPSRAYYGTDTRIADLAVGAVLAWLTARRPETPAAIARWLRATAPVALGLLVVLMVTAGTAGGIPDNFMFRGGFLVASALCAIVIADVRREGSVLALGFTLRPVVAVGLVSYGIYLWHWPVIVFLTPQSSGLTGAALLWARLGVIAALTVVSYYVIELPVRRGRIPLRARWVLYPLAIAVTVAAILIATTPSFVIKSYVRAALVRYAPAEPVRGAGGLQGQTPIRVGHPISRSDPLRIVLLGDSMLAVSQPGVVAALDATGEVQATGEGFPGFGIATDPAWRGFVRHWVSTTHADVVYFTTDWDGPLARHPAAYRRTMLELVDVARAAGASGVVFLQYPKTDPSEAVTAQQRAAAAQDIEAWNAAVAGVPALAPGRAVYFPIAPSVELDGAYSPWVPPPRDPSAPRATWDRIRRVDGVHLCPPGISLYAAAIAADTSSSFALPEPKGPWWVNGWQRAPIIATGDEFCPADHPAP